MLACLDPALATTRADGLIAEFGTLGRTVSAPSSRLAALVGGPAATLLIAHRAAALFALREGATQGPVVATRYDLLEYLHAAMANDGEEALRVFFLNARRELLAEEVVARGGPAGVAVEPRRILLRALEVGATGLVLVHNHPSGDPTPSVADRRFTQRLATAGACLGIHLHDHLIVARDGHACVAIAASPDLAAEVAVIER